VKIPIGDAASGSRDPQHRHWARVGDDAVGHAAIATHGRPAGHERPQQRRVPHWRGWPKLENCRLPFNSFAEYATAGSIRLADGNQMTLEIENNLTGHILGD
jgi:hypothetical protein